MTSDDRAPDEVIERALVRIRRHQQSRHLQHRAAQGDPAAASVATATRFRYLDALDGTSDGLAISEVAEAIGVDRPRSSRLTSELVEDGLVQRDTVPGDSRYARIRLTPRGKQLVDDIHETRRRTVTDALSEFTAEEARTFAVLLERFVDAWPTA
ncbi:MarR family winged helix-turn-helix transcriptional regulator [Micromonospora polyrhachis]|uniref:DNA-binding MarR family transcriptional regulator n=1 Tax=Micromonospora polyrhachis TaxID=1282883 RepID=A0A7W7WNK2_9ACTN|nr:MarR family transcriptional regulator [Micromonospora polyrhachis]MBB4957619.1 DNA-binding MarR family transcriptional regulator [Micromonospora polyrhachis]